MKTNSWKRKFHQPNRPSHFQRPPRPTEGPSEAERRFFSKTSIDPFPRIHLERVLAEPTMRAMDLFCPVRKGQRGLIVSPPKSGKTTFLKHICRTITAA